MTTLAACDRKTQAQAPRAATTVPVVLSAVKTLPVQRAVDVVGTLYGEEETSFRPRCPARIIALYKDVGDRSRPASRWCSSSRTTTI